MDWLYSLFLGEGIAHTVLVLSLVIAGGVLLSKIKIGGISLGVTWILFVGIAAGHFGMTVDHNTLHFIKEFGLILFVFSIGLQVGPGFFSSFKEGGIKMVSCAAAVVAIVFLAIPYGDNKHTDEATVLTMVDDVDKDTFDNPEEAMQCLMAAYGDIQYAMNTTQRHTHEAYQTLEQSQSIIREMFNMNIN